MDIQILKYKCNVKKEFEPIVFYLILVFREFLSLQQKIIIFIPFSSVMTTCFVLFQATQLRAGKEIRR